MAPPTKPLLSSDERAPYKKLLLGEQRASACAPNSTSGSPLQRQGFPAHCMRQSTSHSVQVDRGKRYVQTRQGIHCAQNATKTTRPIQVLRARDNFSSNQHTIGSLETHRELQNKKSRTTLSAMNAALMNKRALRGDSQPPISPS